MVISDIVSNLQTIFNGTDDDGETLVNTSSLAAGSYSVRLVSNRGNIFDSKTLVIR